MLRAKKNQAANQGSNGAYVRAHACVVLRASLRIRKGLSMCKGACLRSFNDAQMAVEVEDVELAERSRHCSSLSTR
jgi:hypothetical protein